MPSITITFYADQLREGFRWADVIDGLGASAHFIRRECVERGEIYHEIKGAWAADIFFVDPVTGTKTKITTWRVDPR